SVLLQLFDRLNLCDRVKDVLFDPMQVFVQWCPALFQLSAPNPAFASKQMIRQPDLNKIWHQPLPRRRDLSTAGRYSYMAIMRTVLAALHRETDPVTYADPESLECYDLGRGFRLVLVGMIPERRLSLDAYIGYMGFKNGVPVAYGGGWIWADQCKIGLNILPAFRGGESAWIFAQILRAYRQRFALRQFRVSPYQYGAGNPEGLRSGAFWLYYKLGFRPETNELKTLADGEWKKVTEQKGYRSPFDILKKFTQAPLICNQGAGSQMRITPAQVSDALSYWIVAAGSANRKAFIKKCSIQQGLHLNGLNKEQQETLALLAGWLIHQEYPESLRKQYLQACRLRWVDSEMNAV
ncbi:MAG TPA: hypothetical protein PKK69_11460, partial [Ferruginibacter sp.]|nr:hypothetical protein [Ferruginibacter sp.]